MVSLRKIARITREREAAKSDASERVVASLFVRRFTAETQRRMRRKACERKRCERVAASLFVRRFTAEPQRRMRRRAWERKRCERVVPRLRLSSLLRDFVIVASLFHRRDAEEDEKKGV
jgi:hypothetical protein